MDNFPKNPSLKAHMLVALSLMPIIWVGMALIGS
jgi:hypothetical protein